MTCGNPFKNKILELFYNCIDMFSVEEKITDEQMECMQFGICDYAPKQIKEIPYFHFWLFYFLNETLLRIRWSIYLAEP